jgi:hypothetical protein
MMYNNTMSIGFTPIEGPLTRLSVSGDEAKIIVHGETGQANEVKLWPPEAWASPDPDQTPGTFSIARNPKYSGDVVPYFVARLAAGTNLEDLNLGISWEGQAEVTDVTTQRATITVVDVPEFSDSPAASSVRFDGVKIAEYLKLNHPDPRRVSGNLALGGTIHHYETELTAGQITSTLLDSPLPHLRVTPYNPSR